MAKKKNALQRWLGKLPLLTKVIIALALVVGLAGGAIVCTVLFDKDTFELKGSKQVSLTVSAENYVYREEGVTAVCFAQDVSDTLKVELSEGIVDNGDGTYTIPTDKAGVYTLTYTVECFKFGESREDGAVKLIRVFTVDEVENDGKDAGLGGEVSD